MTYLISVSDLEKPVIRKDFILDKKLVDAMIDKRGSLGVLIEEMMEEIKKQREGKNEH